MYKWYQRSVTLQEYNIAGEQDGEVCVIKFFLKFWSSSKESYIFRSVRLKLFLKKERYKWRAMFHTCTNLFTDKPVFDSHMYYHYVSDCSLHALWRFYFVTWSRHQKPCLGSISTFPQNLVHIQFPFWNVGG